MDLRLSRGPGNADSSDGAFYSSGTQRRQRGCDEDASASCESDEQRATMDEFSASAEMCSTGTGPPAKERDTAAGPPASPSRSSEEERNRRGRVLPSAAKKDGTLLGSGRGEKRGEAREVEQKNKKKSSAAASPQLVPATMAEPPLPGLSSFNYDLSFNSRRKVPWASQRQRGDMASSKAARRGRRTTRKGCLMAARQEEKEEKIEEDDGEATGVTCAVSSSPLTVTRQSREEEANSAMRGGGAIAAGRDLLLGVSGDDVADAPREPHYGPPLITATPVYDERTDVENGVTVAPAGDTTAIEAPPFAFAMADKRIVNFRDRRIQLCLVVTLVLLAGMTAGVVYLVLSRRSGGDDDEPPPESVLGGEGGEGAVRQSNPPSSSPTSASSTWGPTAPPATNLAWVQAGPSLYEVAVGPTVVPISQLYGFAVSMSSDGRRLAVGSPGCSCVYVYQYEHGASSSSSKWTLLGRGPVGDGDGVVDRIAMSNRGNVLALGYPGDDTKFKNAGKVQLYEYDESAASWAELGRPIYGEAEGDCIGGIVVGCPDKDWSLYDEDFTDDYVPDEWDYDYFGTVIKSIALSANGRIVAIGSPTNGGNGHLSGHVRVFRYEKDTGKWIQMGRKDMDGRSAGSRFGRAVSLSSDGHRLAAGGPSTGAGGNGYVRVYEYNDGADSWAQIGQDIDGVFQLGSSVSISDDGTVIAVGANIDPEYEEIFGVARVLTYSSEMDKWVRIGSDINVVPYQLLDTDYPLTDDFFQGADRDPFHSEVVLSGDGTRLALALPLDDKNAFFMYEADARRGLVRVYEYSEDNWVQIGEPIEGVSSEDYSGVSISLSFDGSRVSVGAPFNDDAGKNNGQVRVFDLKAFDVSKQ